MSAKGRPRLAFVDVLMALGGLAVVASVVYAPLRHRAYEHRVARAISGIEALRAAATRYRDSTGHWPEDAGAGRVSAGLVPILPAGTELHTAEYALGWSRWNVVEIPPQPVQLAPDTSAPPPTSRFTEPSAADSLGTRPPVVGEMGGITVRSTDDGLLGALLKRYGSARSFVRDSSWTLILGPDSMH